MKINQFYDYMAKIKLRFGDNEVEIESRDFYIDNETIGDVIGSVTKHMEENKARIVFEDHTVGNITQNTLDSLEDAEVHEPEFTSPVAIPAKEIQNKLKILDKNSFFDIPRTVSETVERLREHGWSTSPFDVSKALAKMAFNREISKYSKKNRMFYSTKHAVIIS